MRAVIYDYYGPPEVLQVRDIPTPELEHGYVLVRVRAVSVNGGEIMTREGKFRLLTGNRFPKGIGADYAGEVVDLTGVDDLAVGDRVWGLMPRDQYMRGQRGSFAEYVCVPRRQLAEAPDDLDFAEAASLVVAVTPLLALREHASLRAGERLLVRGATGGVGIPGVQLGKAMGAHITGLASANNLDFAREIGADEAFDYRTTAAEDLGRFDVILDTVGTDLPKYRRLLTARGRMIALAMDQNALLRTALTILASNIHGSRRIRFFSANATSELLAELAGFVERGELKPYIQAVYPMEGIVEAHKALAAGGGRGKHVIKID